MRIKLNLKDQTGQFWQEKRKKRRMEKENMFKIKNYYQQMQKYQNSDNKYHQKKKYINEEKKNRDKYP